MLFRSRSDQSAGELRVSFDIRQLRYAAAAADHGSFYPAARALEVEQSALSRAILKLERSIGMPIFERSRAGVTMTLAGSAFIPGTKPIVATADKLVAMMRAAGQGRAGRLLLGVEVLMIVMREIQPRLAAEA